MHSRTRSTPISFNTQKKNGNTLKSNNDTINIINHINMSTLTTTLAVSKHIHYPVLNSNEETITIEPNYFKEGKKKIDHKNLYTNTPKEKLIQIDKNSIQNYSSHNLQDIKQYNIQDNTQSNIQNTIQNIKQNNDLYFQLKENRNDFVDNNLQLNDIPSTSSLTINNNITITSSIPNTNKIFEKQSDLSDSNDTLNENAYNFPEEILLEEEEKSIEYTMCHESISATLFKLVKLLDDYANARKSLKIWEYWFYKWKNTQWYTQKQNHLVSKQNKAKEELLQLIEDNFKNVNDFLKKNNRQPSSTISSNYLYGLKNTRKIWIHQQQQQTKKGVEKLYHSCFGKNNNPNRSKKINKLISIASPSSISSPVNKEKIKVCQNSLSLKYNREFKYYHHYIPETLKHMAALNLAVKYINLWLTLKEKTVLSNEDNKEIKDINKINSKSCSPISNSTLPISINSNKKKSNKNKSMVKCSAFSLMTTLMNKLQLNNNSSDKINISKDGIKYKEVGNKKISELLLFDIEIENSIGYEVKRYLKGICIIELLLIKVNCFDDKLFIHTINFFKQYIDLSFLIPFMKAYIINSPNISSWCVGMTWEFFNSINEIKLFWSIIHNKNKKRL